MITGFTRQKLAFKPSLAEHGQVLALHPDVQPDELLLSSEVCTIGRSPLVCQVIVENNKIVSRVHAKIERQGPRYVLLDANSVNGTFVNGRRIYEAHLLADGDQIGLGSPTALLRFNDPDPTIPILSRLTYNEQTLAFAFNKQPLELSPNQFRLLHHLYQHAGEVCTQESCAEAVWGKDYHSYSDTALHREIANLRKKLRQLDPDVEDMIQTRKGQGYVLDH
ncbi:MAG: hypothetical protein Kow0031_25240 [Anaerolineae bacterium]